MNEIIDAADVRPGDRIRLSLEAPTMVVATAMLDTCNGQPAVRLDVDEGGDRYRFFLWRKQRLVRIEP